jgi:hypothetical protein
MNPNTIPKTANQNPIDKINKAERSPAKKKPKTPIDENKSANKLNHKLETAKPEVFLP